MPDYFLNPAPNWLHIPILLVFAFLFILFIIDKYGEYREAKALREQPTMPEITIVDVPRAP